ncbi:MAG: hypothetical protein JW863_17365 [Chitinispirillaceae bacterium]|nr:hypothetical protein [Chitinispirillaceae bacterium]
MKGLPDRRFPLLIVALNIAGYVTIAAIAIGILHQYKPLPPGLSFNGTPHVVSPDRVQFLHDLTRHDNDSALLQQEIFDSVFALIDRAQQYVLVDMFLMNDHKGKSTSSFRPVSTELADHLIRKKATRPDIPVDVITDPINTVYGGTSSAVIDRLRNAGINVIVTDLAKLRDSNRFYSPFWRLLFSWFGNSPRGGLFPHPFSPAEPKVPLRSYLALLNFKANHRKVIIADDKGALTAIVSTANPHDASARHSNTAFKITSGQVCRDIYKCESSVAGLSGGALGILPAVTRSVEETPSAMKAAITTDGATRTMLLDRIKSAPSGSNIFVALFYVADRSIVSALKLAAKRGVAVTVVLDPNTNAFGYTKRGVPNVPVAAELMKGGCDLRFYRTGEEQFHTKLLLIDYPTDSLWCTTGSANYTRRNLGNLNLEMNCAVSCRKTAPVAKRLLDYRTLLAGEQPTPPYTIAASDSAAPQSTWFKYMRYRFFEASGFSSF